MATYQLVRAARAGDVASKWLEPPQPDAVHWEPNATFLTIYVQRLSHRHNRPQAKSQPPNPSTRSPDSHDVRVAAFGTFEKAS